MNHCENNSADRELGYYWERQFCTMAYKYGKCFTPHQWGKDSSAMAFVNSSLNKYTLPDITIWSCPGEHHEIKHKKPTSHNSIGLELYRYNALYEFSRITKQDVYYTIHNHDLSGGRDGKINNINHWFCAKIGTDLNLKNYAVRSIGNSYVNSKGKSGIEILYWSMDLFYRLADVWHIVTARHNNLVTAELN